jgi:hypothetical protein
MLSSESELVLSIGAVLETGALVAGAYWTGWIRAWDAPELCIA